MVEYPEWTLSFNTEDAVDAAVSRHRQVLQDTQRRINELLSRRNALSLTGRLPFEVLGMVFLAIVEAWVQSHYDEDFSPRYTSEPDWDWLSVTCICRHWRDVALQTPRLWTHIPLNAQNAVSYFDRSGQMPLSIFHHVGRYAEPAGLDATQLLVANMWRVKNLCAPVSSKFVEYAAAHGTLDAPILERVFLRVPVGLIKMFEYTTSDVVRRASWPRLHTFTAALTSSLLVEVAHQPALTSLTVTTPQSRLSVEAWLQLLQKTPRLQSMRLTNAVEESPLNEEGGPAPPALSVSLPSLSSLSLSESRDYSSDGQDLLLSRIAIAPDATIVYHERWATSDTAVFQALATSARGGPNGLGIPRTAVQAIDMSHDGHLHHFSFYTEDDALAFEDISLPLRDPSEGDITVTLGQHWGGVLGSLCEHYPLNELRRIRLTRGARVHADGWNALGQLPSLQVIEIVDGHTSAALCYLPEALSVRQSFPALETLILNDIHWHPDDVDGPHYGPGAMRGDQVLVALESALALRRERGTTLKNLAILLITKRLERWEECKQAINGLKKHVEQMHASYDDEEDEFGVECSECRYAGSESSASDTESDTEADTESSTEADYGFDLGLDWDEDPLDIF